MIPKRTWHLFAAVLGVCVVGYFIYHTVEGERGLVAQMHMKNEVAAAQDKLDRLQKEREALDHRVHLLRSESLDPDLLDEEMRKTLNYSKANEIVVLTPQDSSQPGAVTPVSR